MKGSKFAAVLAELNPAEREAVERHIQGRTSAEWLAEVLTRAGHPVGASTVKAYRGSLSG